MDDPNVYAPEWQPGTPPGIKGQMVGAAAGATELGATVYELDPGVAVSPYHLHRQGVWRRRRGAVLAGLLGRDRARPQHLIVPVAGVRCVRPLDVLVQRA